MLQYPDLTDHGYRIEKTLGHNIGGGRKTYLATRLVDQTPVVLKQFQFDQTDSSWQDFQGFQQELKCLQRLNFEAIPQYLDSFDTNSGCYLVQEYKDAPSLAQSRSLSLGEIQQIAIATLKILVYLQQQSPPMIHRDIKPENLLVDESLNVYLVDFGFARPTGDEVALSSLVKGTMGFMPPEQLLNRQLTTASDLYSLGVTLICLLTQTPSGSVNTLFDETYQLNFLTLLPPLPSTFVRWLQKMVTPQLKERFANAAMALESLQAIDITAPEPKNVDISAAGSGNAQTGNVQPGNAQTWPPKTGKHKTWQQSAIGFAALFSAAFTVGWLEHLKSVPASVRFSSATPAQSSPTLSPEVQRLLTTRECTHCNLRYHNLRGLNLTGVNLQGADLTGAQLQEANLAGADLTGANLQRANFRQSNLRSAQLTEANLEQVNLRCATLNGANLTGANLQQANLRRARLLEADLTGANLMDADLMKANLRHATFHQTNLTHTNLQGATLPNGKIKKF